MKVLELFAGSRSIGKAAEALGLEVLSCDITAYDGIHVVGDVLALPMKRWVEFQPDIIWASPPCTGFSVAAIGHHWGEGRTPKTSTACLGMALAIKTIEIIRACKPKVWYVENPRGMLRTLPLMKPLGTPHTVTYCQYGDTRQKPTDIWTNCTLWTPKPKCSPGATCHDAAPRGSRTGTQGLKGAHDRSKIPQALCTEVLTAAIAQIQAGAPTLFRSTPPPIPKSQGPFGPLACQLAEKEERQRTPELFA